MSGIFESKKALHIYGACALATAILCTLVRFICLLFFFDSGIGYYKSGAVLPIILNVLLLLCVPTALVFCFFKKIKITPVTPQRDKNIKLWAIFPAFGFVAYAFIYISWLFEYSKYYSVIPLSYLINAIALVGSCVFFFLICFKKEISNAGYVLSGICVIIFFIFSLANSYFNSLVQMNSPNKLIFQFACLSGMLLLVNELRQGSDVKHPAFHLFSASVASIYLLTSSIPSAIAYLMGRMPAAYSLFYTDILFAFVCIFAIVRLIQMCFGAEPEVLPEILV
ncbi:MAG: hypothetical protein J6U86_01055, partial [Clostridia bacterium]|nr:hypothetical protein [Clostridia bacterium]